MNEENTLTAPAYFVSVRFRKGDKAYSFSTNDATLVEGDVVIVETVEGYEAAIITSAPKAMTYYHAPHALKPILSRAGKSDLQRIRLNEAYEKRALEFCNTFIQKLELPMDLIDACYTLNGEKVTITYTSTEKRVDFRELLHLLVPTLNCRVELRQLASRDRARMVGGLGICGRPLCCSTFLTNFEGISISRAKNQMLTLNIPKLSGPCGKLICCLTYEDDAYTEAKKEFPPHGTHVRTPEGDYTVDSFNVISRTVRLMNATRDDSKVYTLEDVQAMQKGTYKKKEEKKESIDFLPNYNLQNRNDIGVEDKSDKGAQQRQNGKKPNGQQNSQKNNGNRQEHSHNHHHQNRGNQNRPQGQQKNANQQGQKEPNQDRQNNNHRPSHHRPNRPFNKKENKQ